MSSLPAELQSKLETIIASDRVVLFMKGTRRAPRCGFSASAIEILDELVPNYTTVDVLADGDVREGIKVFSDWPTIPQIYVDKEFVGGADILREMYNSGELHRLLGVNFEPAANPHLVVTDEAASTLREAMTGQEHQTLRFGVSRDFRHQLSFGPRVEGDVEIEANGITFLLDRASAKRADGVSIDFVEGPNGAGFRIDNPNAPATVKQISVKEMKKRLDTGLGNGLLLDVRTEHERSIAKIDAAKHLTGELRAELIENLDKSTPLYFQCHHGGRSNAAAEQFVALGFKSVHNVAGGIDAWSVEVDSSVPRY